MFRKLPFITLLLTAIIFVLSVMPSEDIPQKSWFDFPGVDKVVHMLMYFALTLTFSAETAYRRILNTFNLPVIMLVVFSFSGIMELIQLLFTSSRSGDWFDLLANTGGILLAATFSVFFRYLKFGFFRGFRETPRPGQQ